MKTDLHLDAALVDKAVRVSGRRTRNEAVTEALREYIARRRQAEVTHLFGNIEYDANYEAEKQRRHR